MLVSLKHSNGNANLKKRQKLVRLPKLLEGEEGELKRIVKLVPR